MKSPSARVPTGFGSTILKRPCSLPLLGHLAADFSALVGGSVYVDVPLAGHQIGGLLIGERRRALERALVGAGNRYNHAAVLARFAGMEVGRCRRTAQAGHAALP